MKTETHHPKLLGKYRSICCTGITYTIPACFGDPEFTFCDTCKKQCATAWMPSYKEVSKGTWRKIDYSVQEF